MTESFAWAGFAVACLVAFVWAKSLDDRDKRLDPRRVSRAGSDPPAPDVSESTGSP